MIKSGKSFFVFLLFVVLAVYYYPLRYPALHFLITQLHLHGGVFLFFGVTTIWGRMVYRLFFRRLPHLPLWERGQLYLVCGFLLIGHLFLFLRLFDGINWLVVWLIFLSFPLVCLTRFLFVLVRKKTFNLRVFSVYSSLQKQPFLLLVVAAGFAWAVLFIMSGQYPPVTYDGLSYHLAIPHWWLQEGVVCDYPFNIYSAMPFLWQSLYAFFTLFTAQSGQYLHVIAGILGTINVIYLLHRFIKVPIIPAIIVSLFVFALPEFFYLSRQANIDLGLFYGMSLVVLIAWHPSHKVRSSMLIFLVMGFIVGTKYTALLLFLVPLLVADSVLYRQPARIVKGVLLIIGLNAAHAIKNLVEYGNPVYPLYGFLGSEKYYDYSFFLEHHTPGISEILQTSLVLQPSFLFPVLFIVGFLYFKQRRDLGEEKRMRVCYFLIISVVSWGLFHLFTVGTSRFIFPLWAMILPLLMEVLPTKIYCTKRFLVPLTVFLILSCYWQGAFLLSRHPNPLSYFVGTYEKEEVLKSELPAYGGAVSYINRHLREDPILFIGEARTYHLDNPGNITYNTVFNYNPAALLTEERPDYDTFRDSMIKREWRYVLVNEIELRRLRDFYGDIWHYLDQKEREIWYTFLEDLSQKERIFEYTPERHREAVYIVTLFEKE